MVPKQLSSLLTKYGFLVVAWMMQNSSSLFSTAFPLTSSVNVKVNDAKMYNTLCKSSINDDNGEDGVIVDVLSMPSPDESVKLMKLKSLPESVARIKHVLETSKDQQGSENVMELPNAWIVRISTQPIRFVMVDVPKYSSQLKRQILTFCKGQIPIAIFVTNQNSVYYDNSSVIRKSDAHKWLDAFPGIEFVMHRHDILRDLHKVVTQRLDGYGPWGIDVNTGEFKDFGNPLEEIEGLDGYEMTLDVENYSSPEIEDVDIRGNDLSNFCIAVYTPGHSYGSMCLIAIESQIICSGNTIPSAKLLEGESLRLDAQGIVTTNRGGILRQVESARKMVDEFGDLFSVVLPSRGALQRFPKDHKERIKMMNNLLDLFEEYKRFDS